MQEILNAVIILVSLGAVCAILLIVAAKFMSVPTDERLTEIRACLPGANCGACGYAGCDGYAEALNSGEEERTGKCVPGGSAAAKAIAEVMGLEAEETAVKKAVILCRGDCDATADKMEYEGTASCAAAKLLFGGKGRCIFGCMGMGDCAKACPQKAITVKDGVAKVDPALCIGCGICQKACPNGLIAILEGEKNVFVACSNKEKGAATRKECSNGCIGCKRCEKECPVGAITVTQDLAKIDEEKCVRCGACQKACPIGCITIRDLALTKI